jgi:hypothetical protein
MFATRRRGHGVGTAYPFVHDPIATGTSAQVHGEGDAGYDPEMLDETSARSRRTSAARFARA